MTDEQLAKIKEAADAALLDWFKIRKSDALSLIARLEAAEARAEQEEDNCTSMIALIADIREKSGVGVKPMLSELADAIGARALSAYNEGIEAAANVSIGSVARLPRITNTHKIAEICQFDPLQGWITKEDVIRYGSEITDGIRALLKDKPHG